MNKDKNKMHPELREALLSNLVQLFTLILFGFVSGALLWRSATKNDDSKGWQYFIFAVIFFVLLGVIIYLVKFIKKAKAIKKKEANNHECD